MYLCINTSCSEYGTVIIICIKLTRLVWMESDGLRIGSNSISGVGVEVGIGSIGRVTANVGTQSYAKCSLH